MGFLRLLVLSTLMLGSTLLASFFPLYYHFSPSRLRLISIFSTGLLIGSALGIIIPEGVEAVYGSRPEAPDAHEHGHDHSEMASWVGAGLLAGFLVMLDRASDAPVMTNTGISSTRIIPTRTLRHRRPRARLGATSARHRSTARQVWDGADRASWSRSRLGDARTASRRRAGRARSQDTSGNQGIQRHGLGSRPALAPCSRRLRRETRPTRP